MRILFVVEHFYPYIGGAEELFLNLSLELIKKGHDVSVITTRHNRLLPAAENFNGISITRVNCYNRFLFTVFSLPEIISQRRADIIHTTSYNSALPSFIAGLVTGKKVIITFHEVWNRLWLKLPFTPKLKLLLFYFYEWMILKLPFHRYVAVSDFTAKSLAGRGIPTEKIVRIYNGIDYDSLKNYSHQTPQAFTFCFYGRLGISKGIDILLRGSKIFFQSHPEAKLKMIIPVYPKDVFSKVIRLIEELQIEKNIILLHDLDKDRLFSEISRSSCVIIPSHSEGFCFVAAECAAMNIPVISSERGALPEVTCGRIIPIAELSENQLADSLERAIAGDWNRKPARQFPLSESVEKYVQLYKDLIKKKMDQ